MSQFNAIGEYGLNDVLTKRLTTPGGSNSPSVAPEIFPVLTLESDRPEWSHLKGEGRFSVFFSVAAVAGQYGMVQLYLPTTARSIAVITSIGAYNANPFGIGRLVGISGGLGGWAALGTKNVDTRENAIGGATICETNNNVALPSLHGEFARLQVSGVTWDTPVIIAPGGAICIFAQAVNVILQGNISFYERPAQPGELA